MSSFACENIHQGHERINDKSRGRKEINLCLGSVVGSIENEDPENEDPKT